MEDPKLIAIGGKQVVTSRCGWLKSLPGKTFNHLEILLPINCHSGYGQISPPQKTVGTWIERHGFYLVTWHSLRTTVVSSSQCKSQHWTITKIWRDRLKMCDKYHTKCLKLPSRRGSFCSPRGLLGIISLLCNIPGYPVVSVTMCYPPPIGIHLRTFAT